MSTIHSRHTVIPIVPLPPPTTHPTQLALCLVSVPRFADTHNSYYIHSPIPVHQLRSYLDTRTLPGILVPLLSLLFAPCLLLELSRTVYVRTKIESEVSQAKQLLFVQCTCIFSIMSVAFLDTLHPEFEPQRSDFYSCGPCSRRFYGGDTRQCRQVLKASKMASGSLS